MSDFSVVIIVKGRRRQLANVIDSMQRSDLQPHDIQVVAMDQTDDIRAAKYPRTTVQELRSQETLPLAAARNAGIAATQTNTVIFLDVDSIVAPSLFRTMLAALSPDRIIAAYPKYLPFVPDDGNFESLESQAVSHPDRHKIPANVPVPHLQFWSLIFAVCKDTFQKIGGFDETFTGYGAEDTDFAMSFHQVGIQQIFVKDYVLHQYHDKYDPPFNHFAAIIANATRYHEKWHSLPMGRWLRLFAESDMIRINADDTITVLRSPTDDEIAASLSKQPY